MAKEHNRLSARFVTTVKEPGYYPDGGNLYLQVSKSGSRSWLFIYKRSGTSQRPEMGLGSAKDLSLREARDQAAELRGLLRRGIDPLQAKRASAIEAELVRARSITFADAAAACIAAKHPAWRNAKHAAQCASPIRAHAVPASRC